MSAPSGCRFPQGKSILGGGKYTVEVVVFVILVVEL